MSALIDADAIRMLARDCARRSLAHAPQGGAKLVYDGAAEYFGCLEQLLGRPCTEIEMYEFRLAFDAALAVESTETST